MTENVAPGSSPEQGAEGLKPGRLYAVRVTDRETRQRKTVALCVLSTTTENAVVTKHAAQLREIFDDVAFEDATTQLSGAEYKTVVPISATEILTGKKPAADIKPIRLVKKLPEGLEGLPPLETYMRTLLKTPESPAELPPSADRRQASPKTPRRPIRRSERDGLRWSNMRTGQKVITICGAASAIAVTAAVSWAVFAAVLGNAVGRPVKMFNTHPRGMEPRKTIYSPAPPNPFETDQPPSIDQWPRIVEEQLQLQEELRKVEQAYKLEQAKKARAAQADGKTSEPQEQPKK